MYQFSILPPHGWVASSQTDTKPASGYMPRHPTLPTSLTPAAFQILLAVADVPRHGLGIIAEVKVRTEGVVKLGPGTLYGTIKKLREGGLIVEADEVPDPDADDPRRRYNELTPQGREALVREARRMELLVKVAHQKALLHGGEG